ncbi:cytokinin dehydrogenase 6-like [Canna indica]|uniref:cytokinin dehydrogenase n=1 Tax=Canna indica TaxID=4628 RepID=A0AAQ3JV78_9LILI|nr:cytokinin dehydrogenase 6-like [Canna indica]
MVKPAFLVMNVITLSLVAACSLVSAAPDHDQLRPWPATLPQGLLDLRIVDQLRFGPNVTARFSTDYGRLTEATPAAVLYPPSAADIAALVRLSFSSPRPFAIAARGHGHSVRGQALAPCGVVVDMASLGGAHGRVNVRVGDDGAYYYVDAGGEQLWIDVLRESLNHGVAPRSWTDYLYLTVGGTLSNAGIGGQAFRHGPQISNVYELDVITGKGDMITCSPGTNSDLFYGVLGGLGQLGIITRARIAVEPAPERVRWVRLIYTDLGSLTRDQELLLSITEKGFDYIEGELLTEKGIDNSSFFSCKDSAKINALAAEFRVIYFLEGALYYKLNAASQVDERLESLLKKLKFVPGFAFTKDVSYVRFLNRVHEDEIKLRPLGLWDVPHPWLNVFVPKSSIRDFEIRVIQAILTADSSSASAGTFLITPMNKTKWDDQMSVATPDEEVFYAVGLLRSATEDDWKRLDRQNEEIISTCEHARIELKQYLPYYRSQEEWKRHFGRKWERFAELKSKYDPKALLSPGQRIFTSLTVS